MKASCPYLPRSQFIPATGGMRKNGIQEKGFPVKRRKGSVYLDPRVWSDTVQCQLVACGVKKIKLPEWVTAIEACKPCRDTKEPHICPRYAQALLSVLAFEPHPAVLEQP